MSSENFFPLIDTSSGFLSGAENHLMNNKIALLISGKMIPTILEMELMTHTLYKDDLKNIFDNNKEKKHLFCLFHLITNIDKESDPFFLYLPLHNIHGPF